MTSPVPRESYRDTWRRERAESEEALQELESSDEGREAVLTLDEQLEQSRNSTARDPESYCAVHARHLSYPEWNGVGCLWCYYGSQEKYAAYLESRNLDRTGRPKKVRAARQIA